MLALLNDPDEAVTHIALAFDNPVTSFRNDLFDGYKTGEGMDPAIGAQFELVERATNVLGITVWSMDRFEADDALATAARRWRDDFDQVRILTPDKDLGQCVIGNTVIQIDRSRQRVINEDGVRERNGVDPASIPDWLGLVGDTADGIPGLPRFGAKSAALLLSHYKHIEAIPDDPKEWQVKVRGAERLGAILAEQRDDAMLYKRLATLEENVPLDTTLSDLEWRGADRQRFEKLTQYLGGIGGRPKRWRD